VSAVTPAQKQLFLPVILGTPRQGRRSEHVARFVVSRLETMPDVETELIDLRTLTFPSSDEGEAIKDPVFSAAMTRMDGLVIVVPEYNHGYPGMLKHALDTNLKEYIHKPVGLCGVSAGPWGGTRAVENLLPVLRELGLVTIFWDLNFPKADRVFDPETGALLEAAHIRRFEKFANELVWMARVLGHGRANVAIGGGHLG
jgi:NAD(P)H-dependent FMN reductase